MIQDVSRLLKVLGDETRLRLVHVLSREEVSASELGEVLNLGQSRVSSQVALLREVGLLKERREGKRVYLSLEATDPATAPLLALVRPQIAASPVCRTDEQALRAVVERRRADGAGFFDPTVGSFGSRYLPGRTWEGFARALLGLVPRGRVADIGVGDGDMTLLLATIATELIAVDPSEAALGRLRTKAERLGLSHVVTRRGEIENLDLDDGAVDLVVASQVLHCAVHPAPAIAECARVLAPGGKLVVLDLKKHDEDWVREKLGHVRLGFSEKELRAFFVDAELERVQVGPVARDRKAPHFVTLLATGEKAS